MALLQVPSSAARRTKALLQAQRPDGVLALCAGSNNVAKLVEVTRPAERGQRHDLIFVRGMQESQVFGNLFVQDAERVGEMHLTYHGELIIPTQAVAGRGPLASSIQREHSGALEGRGEKGAGGMSNVVLDKVPLK